MGTGGTCLCSLFLQPRDLLGLPPYVPILFLLVFQCPREALDHVVKHLGRAEVILKLGRIEGEDNVEHVHGAIPPLHREGIAVTAAVIVTVLAPLIVCICIFIFRGYRRCSG